MNSDLYDILCIPRTATPLQIKEAYRNALLRHHPDKQIQNGIIRSNTGVEFHLLKKASETLSDPRHRTEYDASLDSPATQGKSLRSRPAQIVSLQEFEEVECDDSCVWRYNCRCGGSYEITEDDMEKGQHLIGCCSCSEVIWAGYEAEEGNECA